MMPSAKIVTFDRFPPENMVHPEHAVLPELIRERRQRLDVHAGRRDVVTDAVHPQQPQREQHAVAQVGDGEDVLQTFHMRS